MKKVLFTLFVCICIYIISISVIDMQTRHRIEESNLSYLTIGLIGLVFMLLVFIIFKFIKHKK